MLLSAQSSFGGTSFCFNSSSSAILFFKRRNSASGDSAGVSSVLAGRTSTTAGSSTASVSLVLAANPAAKTAPPIPPMMPPSPAPNTKPTTLPQASNTDDTVWPSGPSGTEVVVPGSGDYRTYEPPNQDAKDRAEQSAEATAAHSLQGSVSHLTFLQTRHSESNLRPGNPHRHPDISGTLGSLFALVTIIGGMHPKRIATCHLGLRLRRFHFVVVPVAAWTIVRILGPKRDGHGV